MSIVTNQYEKPCPPPRDKNEKQHIIATVKSILKELYNGDFIFHKNFCLQEYIGLQLGVSCIHADTCFAESEGKTIAQYAVDIRVNKVKELLVYTSIPAATIATKMNYCNVAALSAELLQQTGLPVEFFINMKKQKEQLALHQRLEAKN